jgi:hypothetical protein
LTVNKPLYMHPQRTWLCSGHNVPALALSIMPNWPWG